MVQRRTQTLDELTARLAAVDASSLDEFAQKVAAFLESFPVHPGYGPDDLLRMLREDFEVAKAAFQLFLGVSKDEFTQLLRKHGAGTAGIKTFRADPAAAAGCTCETRLARYRRHSRP